MRLSTAPFFSPISLRKGQMESLVLMEPYKGIWKQVEADVESEVMGELLVMNDRKRKHLEHMEKMELLQEEMHQNEERRRDEIIQKMMDRMKKHKELMKQQSVEKRRRLNSSGENQKIQGVAKQGSRFELLPDEVVKSVLEYCDLQDLATFAQLSKRTYQISQDEVFWKRLYDRTWTLNNLSPNSSPTRSGSGGICYSSQLYRDLLDGETVLWKVSFKKRYQKELSKKKREERNQKLRELGELECKYCNQKKALIVGSANKSSVFLVSNRTPRYTISIECHGCGRKWTEGRGEEGDSAW
eukprot:TRINITY_DN7841_c0_g1_i2.p1 TRINITY_DN7841_c0_g1~~TRINITY_DN7841_c0_g1_i2.p1  ORF type:complete len:299 (+),score=81.52 TRINITY_DN7841_c0_g1_i2:61-957(+)